MKRNVSLYIAGTKVDLNDDSLILFNYIKDDLNNPTAVKNSYSHKVTLKGTPTNNKLFGDIFRMDRQTLYSDQYIGVFFDPMRKTPFTIYDDTNAVLESGYIKLDSVSMKGNDISYTVTLYGGLGSFFYGLMYNEDGSKKTLADISYKTLRGRRAKIFNVYPEASTVAEAWQYLKDPENFDLNACDFDCWNILNFAPCYNGVPENFDANKALFRGKGVYANGVTSTIVDGVSYYQKEGATSNLATFANPHTEWEVKDLRWYLQRPVISIKSIFEAISYSGNNGGYQVELDPNFFNEDNVAYSRSWITLSTISKDDRSMQSCLYSCLKATLSPAEYIISFAKIFGLIFLYDTGTKKVSILSRNTFYQKAFPRVDLRQRINHNEPINIEMSPVKSKWYQLGGNVIGQFAEEYQKDYGRPYAIQRIDTGYEFDVKVNDLTSSIVFNDAVEVLESNRMFGYRFVRSGNRNLESFLLPAYEEVNVELWATITNSDGTKEEQSVSVPMKSLGGISYFDNPEYEYSDWMPKVQLHGSENKSIDGSNVLIMFEGTKKAPKYVPSLEFTQKKYWLTDDHPDMALLNEKVPCWNLTGDGIEITELPSFRRVFVTDGVIKQSFEWGEPYVRAVPDIHTGGNTLYDLWWKNYLTDLYNDDTRVMKCKVNLRGLQVGQELLRQFFWYDNSLWVLNKINNHSITTYDDAECEFIKVNDYQNYTNGQK